MRRDRKLEEKIALIIEDSSGYPPAPLQIDGYSDEQVAYHVWLMMQEGFVEGVDVTSMGDVHKQGVANGLTPRGHDLAERARVHETPDAPAIPLVRSEKSMTPTRNENPRLFISHSSDDKEFAELLAELLRASLNLRPKEIRCTSLDGYRLKGDAVLVAPRKIAPSRSDPATPKPALVVIPGPRTDTDWMSS